jgi:hypothetical protein
VLGRIDSRGRRDRDCTSARLSLSCRGRSAFRGRDARTKRTVQRRRRPDPVDVAAQDSAVLAVKAATQLVLLLADGIAGLARQPQSVFAASSDSHPLRGQ